MIRSTPMSLVLFAGGFDGELDQPRRAKSSWRIMRWPWRFWVTKFYNIQKAAIKIETIAPIFEFWFFFFLFFFFRVLNEGSVWTRCKPLSDLWRATDTFCPFVLSSDWLMLWQYSTTRSWFLLIALALSGCDPRRGLLSHRSLSDCTSDKSWVVSECEWCLLCEMVLETSLWSVVWV